MEITLVNANILFEVADAPLKTLDMQAGLLGLASILEEAGHKVSLVDLAWMIRKGELELDDRFFDRATAAILAPKSKIVAFNTRCDTYPTVLNIVKKLKQRKADVVVVLGGPQAGFSDEETLEIFPEVDYIMRGEAEINIIPFMDALAGGRSFSRVPGLTYREADKVRRNPDGPIPQNLAVLPRPAYHLMDQYISPNGGFKGWDIYLSVGRGCPGKCKFCCSSLLNRRNFRQMPPEMILGEMCYLRDRYGVDSFTLGHDHFLLDRMGVEFLCQVLIDAKQGFTWNCIGRLDALSPRLVEMMKEAGCTAFLFGVESGSDRMQKIMGKRLQMARVMPNLELCNTFRMRAIVSLIVGFPEETEEDLNETLMMALKMRKFPYVFPEIHLLSPMPGTPYYEENKDDLLYTGVHSDVTENPTAYMAANQKLIKKYPHLFSAFYQIKPEFSQVSTVLEVYRTFPGIIYTYPFSTLTALHDLGLTPVQFLRELKKWAKQEGHTEKYLFLTQADIATGMPKFLEEMYKEKEESFDFTRILLKMESKKLKPIMKEARRMGKKSLDQVQELIERQILRRTIPVGK
ncbi:MAG: B12-binding domain-containing radical SAM protein [Chloroflexi bacterium]|nr:B12-binding domain-containing radical SAM protein [Chloroflexota bacterium]